MTQFEQALRKVQSANWHERSEALKYLQTVDVPMECKEIIRLILTKNNVELLTLLINLFAFWSSKFNLEILSLCLARAFELQDHENRKVKSKAANYIQSFLDAPDVPTSLKYECMRMAYPKIHSKKISYFLKAVTRYRMLPLVSVIIDQVDKNNNVELCLELLIHLEDPRALRAFYREINSSDCKRVALAIKGIGTVGNIFNGLTLVKFVNHESVEIQICALVGLVRLWKHFSLYYPKKYFILSQNIQVKKAILDAFVQTFSFQPSSQVIEFLVEQYLLEERQDILTLIFNTLVSFPREYRALVLRKYSRNISEKQSLKFINLLQVTPHPILKSILFKWAFDLNFPFLAISAMQILAEHDDPAIALQFKRVAFDCKHPLSIMAFKALLAHPHVDRPKTIDEFLDLGTPTDPERHHIILHALKSFPANFCISPTLLGHIEKHLTGPDLEFKLLCIEALRYIANEKIVQKIDGMLVAEREPALIKEIVKSLSYVIQKDPQLARSILYCWEQEAFIKSFSRGLSEELVKHIIMVPVVGPSHPNLRPFFSFHEHEVASIVQVLLKQQFGPALLQGILSCVQKKMIPMNTALLDYIIQVDFSDLPFDTALVILEEMALSKNQDLKQRALREYWTMAHDPLSVRINFKNLLEKALVAS
ncbi:MAG: hypothetical protein HYV97_19160 [Bdellovibrio sp.]|nr:hypothetical protein [Bdellovibrio sp.]